MNDSTELNQNKIKSNSSARFEANWKNILFFVPIHLLGIVAWPIYLLMGGNIRWPEIFVFILMFFWGTIGVDVAYHRGFAHLSFRMRKFFKIFFLLGASSTAEGSALAWCSDHRRHHKFQDTDDDPYNIKRSFWWAHMGWILGAKSTNDFSNSPDLLKDPMLRNQDRYYAVWMIATCFVLPLALGFLLGRPIACFLLAGFTRLFIVDHCTFFINSYAHYFGRRPYSNEITARDSLICAILAQGEGWHNFHHRFPWDYRNGHRFYHYDPTKWIIRMGNLLGWTTNLKQTPSQEIYRARIQAQRTNVKVHDPHIEKIYISLDEALLKWQKLSLEWTRFRHEVEELGHQKIETLKHSLEESKREFLALYSDWRFYLKQPKLVSVLRR